MNSLAIAGLTASSARAWRKSPSAHSGKRNGLIASFWTHGWEDLSAPRVLIADDEPHVCELLSRLLDGEGFECDTASTGLEALEKLHTQSFALVIADIRMPVVNGLQLLKHVSDKYPDVAVVVITGMADVQTAVEAMQQGAFDYVTKPFNTERIVGSVKRALSLRQQHVQSAQNLDRLVRRKTVATRSALRHLKEYQAMTLEALLKALEARGDETCAHSRRVQDYAVRLGEQFGFRNGRMASLADGALLHDIGKIGISDSILLKPDRLTPEEEAEMRKHPVIGNQIVRDIKFLERAAPVVLHHHERYDGSGYPSGLSGDQIPLEARIFSVMDAYDAIKSDRPYRQKLSTEFARQEILRNTGTQFDPMVVKEFLKVDQRDWDGISLKY